MPKKVGLTVESRRKKYFLDDRSRSIITALRYIAVNMYIDWDYQQLSTLNGLETVVSFFLALIPVFLSMLMIYVTVLFALNIVLKAGMTKYELISMSSRLWMILKIVELLF